MPVPVREASIVWMTYRVHMCFAPSCGGSIDRQREEMHERCARDVVWGSGRWRPRVCNGHIITHQRVHGNGSTD